MTDTATANAILPPSTFLPAQWTTPRISIADSTLADAPRLTALFNACHYAHPWDPTFRIIKEEKFNAKAQRSRDAEARIKRKAAKSGGRAILFYISWLHRCL
jgi:hypothetical protein